MSEIISLRSGCAGFPPLLLQIPFPPQTLYIKGALPAGRSAAIVGTRKATISGKTWAKKFARVLSEAGFAIVSGLAFGIDAAAHEGALEAGGKTFAVLANGLDQVYPRSHAGLADKILAAGGGLVSEYPSGTPPLEFRFLERNRIISGLSSLVLIIEAPARSGAMATARFATDQNRDVYVLPGPAEHRNFAGSHRLIRQGATLIASPEDLLEDLGLSALPTAPKLPSLPPEAELIISSLRGTASALSIDEISKSTKLTPPAIHQSLTLLLLKNAVHEENGRYMLN